MRDSLAGAGDAWCTGEQAWRAEWGSGELGARERGCACWPLRRLEAETCENCLIFYVAAVCSLVSRVRGSPGAILGGQLQEAGSALSGTCSGGLAVRVERSGDTGLMME